ALATGTTTFLLTWGTLRLVSRWSGSETAMIVAASAVVSLFTMAVLTLLLHRLVAPVARGFSAEVARWALQDGRAMQNLAAIGAQLRDIAAFNDGLRAQLEILKQQSSSTVSKSKLERICAESGDFSSAAARCENLAAQQQLQEALKELRNYQHRRQDQIAAGRTHRQLINDQVEQLSFLTEPPREIAIKANLLALHATIVAVQAGEAGRGVAAEAHLLAAQADQAALQVCSGIAAVTLAIGEELLQAHAAEEGKIRHGVPDDLAALVARLDGMEERFRGSIGQLNMLTGSLETNLALIVAEVMASLEFQAATRQQIGDVAEALTTLDGHLAALGNGMERCLVEPADSGLQFSTATSGLF
ncbi:MAG: hypothetical protein ACHQIO_17890, partial [Nevskiales bacterium]